ncbi:putative uncharacterized protein [Clostridium sp. CAG:411]|jgi:predicted RecA/RadA family phage recombinase|nr:putative uncharacterized protein [Clostridium sp. CAG:411]DAW23641.1 MAG TPA: protein of unknown function DUF2190 [Caudoviricetes sp.]
MKATFWQRGEALDYKNTTSSVIEANTVVAEGSLVGVIGTDINPGETGSLHVAGVFEMVKTASDEIKFGDTVYFNKTAGEITKTSSGNAVAGYAASEAGTTATTVLVKLLG